MPSPIRLVSRAFARCALLCLLLATAALARAELIPSQCLSWSEATVGGGFSGPGFAAMAAYAKAYPACIPSGSVCSDFWSDGDSNQTCLTSGTPTTYCYQNVPYGVVDAVTLKMPSGHQCAIQVLESGKGLGNCNDGGGPCPGVGNPVNMGTGNKYQREEDFAFPGGLSFIRYYNSRMGGYRRTLGRNWVHNWGLRIEAAKDGSTAAALRADGKLIVFTPSGGLWVGPPDRQEKLTAISGGWQLTGLDDQVEVYNSKGALLSITTRDGRTANLNYADGTSGPNGGFVEGSTTPLGAGTLLKVTDVFGRTILFGYDAKGNLTRVTAPDGGIYRYVYDTIDPILTNLISSSTRTPRPEPTSTTNPSKSRAPRCRTS